jgi:hypothetical protein
MNQKSLDKKKPKELDWEKVAFLFHNTYEGLAPKFGYETRKDTKAFDTKSQNGQLMIATCKAVVSHFLTQQRTELLEEIRELIDSCYWISGTNYVVNGKQEKMISKSEIIEKFTNLLNKKDE